MSPTPKQVISEQLAEQSTFHNLVGHSKSMGKLFEMVKRLSDGEEQRGHRR